MDRSLPCLFLQTMNGWMDGDESEIGAVRLRYHCHGSLLGCLVGFKVPAPSCTLPLACPGRAAATRSILEGEGEGQAPLRPPPPLSTPRIRIRHSVCIDFLRSSCRPSSVPSSPLLSSRAPPQPIPAASFLKSPGNKRNPCTAGVVGSWEVILATLYFSTDYSIWSGNFILRDLSHSSWVVIRGKEDTS